MEQSMSTPQKSALTPVSIAPHEATALAELAKFGLLDAIHGRRSRRFPVGGEVPAGPLAWKSNKPVQPLSDLERATSMVLEDLHDVDPRLGLLKVFAAVGDGGFYAMDAHDEEGAVYLLDEDSLLMQRVEQALRVPIASSPIGFVFETLRDPMPRLASWRHCDDFGDQFYVEGVEVVEDDDPEG